MIEHEKRYCPLGNIVNFLQGFADTRKLTRPMSTRKQKWQEVTPPLVQTEFGDTSLEAIQDPFQCTLPVRVCFGLFNFLCSYV